MKLAVFVRKCASWGLILASLLVLTACERLRPTNQALVTPISIEVEQVTPAVVVATAVPIVVNTPPPPAPTDVIVQLPTPEFDFVASSPPRELTRIAAWLEAAWLANLSRDEASAALAEAGWLIPEQPLPDSGMAGSFAQADVNGDGLDEWIVSLRLPDSLSHAMTIPFQRAYPGNLFVVGQSGILYTHYRTEAISAESTAVPFLLSLNDFTGDGRPDLLIDEMTHNGQQYFGRFYLLSASTGTVRDISSVDLKRVRPQPQLTIGDDNSVSIRLRYADNPTAPTGYWQSELYQWNGSQLVQTATRTEKPSNAASLAAYLETEWAVQTDAARVRANLLDWGWLREQQQWITGDFDGDLRDDWALIVSDPMAEPAVNGELPADIWVVSANGVFMLDGMISAETATVPPANMLQRISDITGDGLPELLVEQTSCGASTCFHTYRVISGANGTLSNIVQNDGPAELSDGRTDTISQSYAQISIDNSEPSALPQLRIEGGALGSAGAGIVRTGSSYWGWSPDTGSVSYLRSELDPTNYRHLLLYEANALTSDIDQAGVDSIRGAAGATLYERIINDSELADPPAFDESEPGPAQAAEQFAAFRLIYIRLSQGALESATVWMNFLESAYAEEGITVGARAMFDAIAVGGAPSAGCAAGQAVMNGYENPVGALANLGYGNPSLSVADLCTP